MIRQLEQGKKTDPRLSTLAALADSLDVTIDELVGRSEPPAKRRPARGPRHRSNDPFRTLPLDEDVMEELIEMGRQAKLAIGKKQSDSARRIGDHAPSNDPFRTLPLDEDVMEELIEMGRQAKLALRAKLGMK
jgi:transcriptional regulator with XRE-family HTH domain